VRAVAAAGPETADRTRIDRGAEVIDVFKVATKACETVNISVRRNPDIATSIPARARPAEKPAAWLRRLSAQDRTPDHAAPQTGRNAEHSPSHLTAFGRSRPNGGVGRPPVRAAAIDQPLVP
jgi:hypothetical protein